LIHFISNSYSRFDALRVDASNLKMTLPFWWAVSIDYPICVCVASRLAHYHLYVDKANSRMSTSSAWQMDTWWMENTIAISLSCKITYSRIQLKNFYFSSPNQNICLENKIFIERDNTKGRILWFKVDRYIIAWSKNRLKDTFFFFRKNVCFKDKVLLNARL